MRYLKISCILFLAHFTMLLPQDPPEGTLIEDGFVSALVPKSPDNTEDNRRLFTVYLPPGYDATDERYPVVYHLPGLGGSHKTATLGNKVLLDQLIPNNEVVPIIVIHVDPRIVDGIDVDGRRKYEASFYVNSNLNGQFEDYIINELILYVDTNYRTKASKGFRAVFGHSMGGHGSLFLGISHPETFIGFGSESGTPLWVIIDELNLLTSDPLFFYNEGLVGLSVLNELPTNPADSNFMKIRPENGGITKDLFILAGAFSPNLSGNTPFRAEFFVDLPMLIEGDGTAILDVGGKFQPDPAVVARWHEKNPYFLMDSKINELKKQAIHVDAGDKEAFNNISIRLLSDKLIANNINHEYILYHGGHTGCLTETICARNQTIFKHFSGKFAEAGQNAHDVRTKIVGTGTIVLEQNGMMEINNGTIVGIETSPSLGIKDTDITIQILDQAHLNIGNQTPGGALQIGDRFGKALLIQDNVTGNPTPLTTHTVACQILVNGPGAQIQIGREGFLGFGAGVDGKAPDKPNFWAVSSLESVQNIQLDIQSGSFIHNQIASGNENAASLFAIGPSNSFTFRANPPTGTMLGGGNLVCFDDSILLHPTINNTPGEFTSAVSIFGRPGPGGIRRALNTDPNHRDPVYNEPDGSRTFYTNEHFVGVLSSTELLDDRGTPNPFEITTASIQDLHDFFDVNEYLGEASKEANLAMPNGELCMNYVDNNEMVRIPQSEIPVLTNQTIDFNNALQKGAIGLQLETIDGERQLVWVYELDPQ